MVNRVREIRSWAAYSPPNNNYLQHLKIFFMHGPAKIATERFLNQRVDHITYYIEIAAFDNMPSETFKLSSDEKQTFDSHSALPKYAS